MTRIQYMLVDFEHCAGNYGCKNKWHDPCLREVWCPAGGTVMYQDKTRSPTVLNDSGMAVAPDFLERNWRPFPMDGGAWWAAVHGVAKSQIRLSDFTFTFHFLHWRRKWPPTPVFLPGESRGRGSLVGCCLWGRTESDTTEAT